MNALKLGQLESVDLRTVWNNEASDFTPWLAREENLALLGDVIGLELELQAQEQSVGPYRADIVCRDTRGDWVLIENQLEATDHNHLGQLLTYAAGLNAVNIIWIADRITDEHRAALDWLNEITDDSANFFGLEIELWQIGSSEIAPKFNVVSKPNEWIKSTGGGRRPPVAGYTETQQLQLDFWTAFREYLSDQGSRLKGRKPYPQHWMDFAAGRAHFWLSANVHSREDRIGVSLLMDGPAGEAHFRLLERDKEEIESALNASLDWSFQQGRKQNHINLYRLDSNIWDRTHWPELHSWLAEKLELFDDVFRPRIKALNATDYVGEYEEEPME